MEKLKHQLQKSIEACEKLKEENRRLKQLLKRNNISAVIEKQEPANKMGLSTKNEKINAGIKIYRSLFKGREDVFAVRWEYQDGNKGYSPASERKRYYKSENKKYLPLTDQVIYDHLKGRKTIGIYPMLKDETCWFLAADFDKGNWQEDAGAFIDVCKALLVPASIERSRSGNGCHIWIFFDTAIPAKLARQLGNVLLTRTLEKRYQVGIASYDRLFPNQDTLPQGGFGNLIALPLQHFPRKENNSVFVDESFNILPDQWLYLSRIKKMGMETVKEIVKNNNRNNDSATIINEKK